MRKTLIASLIMAGLVAAPTMAAAKSGKPTTHKVVKHEKKAKKETAGKTN
jgi:hypothetical protein